MYPNCMLDNMILAQDILFTRMLYYTKCRSRKREIIQSNIYRILPKVNQVIYTLDTICEPNIIVLTQAVLQIFCSKVSIGLQCKSRKRDENGTKTGHNSAMRSPTEKKQKYRSTYLFMLIPYIKFQDPISNRP